MIFLWHRWLRLVVASMLAMCGLAVLVGRSHRPLPEQRIRGAPSFVYVDHPTIDRGGRDIVRIDPEAGVLKPIRLPEEVTLEHAAGSPWRDNRGGWRVVGRGGTQSGASRNPVPKGYYLALYEFPTGSLLARVETELLPIGTPCWEPGTSARIAYAGGDGALYWYDFDDPDPLGSNHLGSHGQPQEISWRCLPPGLGSVRVAEPSWPAESRFGRRLLVSLSSLERLDGRLGYSSWQLWWLRLDATRMTIVAADPLVRPDPTVPGSAQWGDHLPTLLSGPGGEMAVAYLAFRPSMPRGELRISPLRIDPATGDPQVAEQGAALAGDCLRAPLAPSADGRRIGCVVQPAGSSPRLLCVDLANHLPR